MNKSYNDIMKNVEVTDEMRSRILHNISAEAAAGDKTIEYKNDQDRKKSSNKIIQWKKTFVAVACMALLVTCGAIMKNADIHNNKENNGNYGMAAGPVADIEECGSAEELSSMAGFTVQAPDNIPFELTSVSYTWRWNELAQIDCYGDNNSVSYRKAVGNDDISGDYSEYGYVWNRTIKGRDILLKGNNDLIYLAVWTYEGYTYSISVSGGIDYDDMEKIIESINRAAY